MATLAMSYFSDRIWRQGVLVVICLLSILLLESQSAASFGTYLLALSMLLGIAQWKDALVLRGFWLLAGLGLYLTISSFWSDEYSFSEFLSVFVRLLLTLTFTVALAECQLRGQVQRWLARSFALVGLIAVAAAMAAHITAPPVDGRLSGLGQLDNQVVASLVWAFLLVFALRLFVADRSTSWRVFGAISALIFAIAIGMTGSRTGWVAAFLGCLVFLASTYLNRRTTILVLAVTGLVLCMAVSLGWLFLTGEQIALLLPRGASFRPEIWSAALASVIPEKLLLGAGILTSDDFLIRGQIFQHPHSMYVSMIFQGGLFALGLFLISLGWALVTFFRHFSENDAKLGMAVLAVTIPAYFLDGHELLDKVGDTWLLFWLPMGLALGLRWRELASYRVH